MLTWYCSACSKPGENHFHVRTGCKGCEMCSHFEARVEEPVNKPKD